MIAALTELEQKLLQLKAVNQKRDSMFDNHRKHSMDSQTKDSDAYIEETTLTRLQQHNGAAPMTAQSVNGASAALVLHTMIGSVLLVTMWVSSMIH